MWYAIAKPNLKASKKRAPRVRNTPVDKNDKKPGSAADLFDFDFEGEAATPFAFVSRCVATANGFSVHESSPAAIAAEDGPAATRRSAWLPFNFFGLPAAAAARSSSAAAAVAEAAGGAGKVCRARKVTTT